MNNYKKMLILFVIFLSTFGLEAQTIPSDLGMKARINGASIPKFDLINFYGSNYHSRGFQWALYSMKCPLAWEITKGQNGIYGKEVFIGAAESLGSDINPTHPDMSTNFTLISHQYGSNTQTIKKRGIGDSPRGLVTSSLRDGHGLTTLSCAIAGENDGTNAPMVGVAPKCYGFYTTSGINYTTLDVDGKSNGDITLVDVTFEAMGPGVHNYPNLIHNGIISFIGAGNSITVYNSTTSIYDAVTGKSSNYWLPQAVFGADNNSFSDARYPGNVQKSIKPITIGGLRDGELLNDNCEFWAVNHSVNPNFKGSERFAATKNPVMSTSDGCWTFSMGKNKFSNNLSERNDAFVDLVVPAIAVFNAHENSSQNNQYYRSGSGTSQGSAMAAGVGALMRSVSKYLLAPLNSVSKQPLYKQDVHKSAYDILTFTADKVPDGGIMPDTICNYPVAKRFVVKDANGRDVFGDYYNYDYAVQNNDALKRSWAIRMGFGKINAYRAVAHSIRNKGEYEYTLTRSASAGFNSMNNIFKFTDATNNSEGYYVDGKRVVHFGSKIKEGTAWFEMDPLRGPTTANNGVLNVLEWGGINYAPPLTSIPIGGLHNNQGVTKVNSTSGRSYFSVPQDCILAVDGIILSEQPQNCNYIIADQPGSKILVDGYIYDIELCGNIKAGDVTVHSTINNGVANQPGCLGLNYNSDVYGKLTSKNYGYIYNWGTTTFHPGSGVYLIGYTDFICNGSSHTIFKSATEVLGGLNVISNKLTTKGSSKITIDTNSTVTFNCELNMQDNSELILQPGAILHLKKLSAGRETKITMYVGSTLFLGCGTHTAGKITVMNATANNRANIRNKAQDNNCYPHDTPQYLNATTTCYAYLSMRSTSNVTTSNCNINQYVIWDANLKSAEFNTDENLQFSILSMTPNPTNSEFNLTYSIPSEGNIYISLYNILGDELLELYNTYTGAGTFTKEFSLAALPQGVYYIKMIHNGNLKTEKIIKN